MLFACCFARCSQAWDPRVLRHELCEEVAITLAPATLAQRHPRMSGSYHTSAAFASAASAMSAPLLAAALSPAPSPAAVDTDRTSNPAGDGGNVVALLQTQQTQESAGRQPGQRQQHSGQLLAQQWSGLVPPFTGCPGEYSARGSFCMPLQTPRKKVLLRGLRVKVSYFCSPAVARLASWASIWRVVATPAGN